MYLEKSSNKKSRDGFYKTPIVMSSISLIISITCFAYVSKISRDYGRLVLQSKGPKVMVDESSDFKSTIVPKNTDKEEAYSATMKDIGNLISGGGSSKSANNNLKDIGDIGLTSLEAQQRPSDLSKQQSVKSYKVEKKIEDDNVSFSELENDESGAKTKISFGRYKTPSEAIAKWIKLRRENPVILDNLKYKVVSVTDEAGENYELIVDRGTSAEAKRTYDMVKKHGIQASITN